ncbi:hypothetical protein HK100_000178 [Physocladia obscura]|uniref:Uncharacterized protein n=1 Tax=Physocladia obscura TaxID=109957 RepID=A0AAD5TAH0_9FUNG|nr:hypothetical protein HK100_000178 [Physocladia obscura]
MAVPGVSDAATNGTIDWSIDLEIAAAHIAATISFTGAIISSVMLASMWRNRRRLFPASPSTIQAQQTLSPPPVSLSSQHVVITTPPIPAMPANVSIAIIVICVASALHGILMTFLNEVWVVTVITDTENQQQQQRQAGNDTDIYSFTGGPLDGIVTATTFASATYILLCTIFTANLLLALERRCAIKNNRPLRRITFFGLFGVGAVFATFIVSSFVLTNTTASWLYLPFGIPCIIVDPKNTTVCSTISTPALQSILFLFGLAYLPATALAVCVVYENTYFLIQSVNDNAVPPLPPSSLSLYSSNKDGETISPARKTRIERAILVRCVCMSVSLVAFYVPSVVLVFVEVVAPSTWVSLYVSQTWLIVMADIVPAMDPLWTPVLLIGFHDVLREMVLGDLRELMRRIVFWFSWMRSCLLKK